MFASLAAIVFVIDWWLFSKERTSLVRVAGLFLSAVLLAAVCWFAFRPAPLLASFGAFDRNYQEGSNIAVIAWNDAYSEIRVRLTNHADGQYENLDMLLQTDLSIAQIGVNDQFSQCVTAPDGMPEIFAEGRGENGKR